MIKLTSELITHIENYYDLSSISTTPFWTDHCEHSPDTYVCSFVTEHIHEKKVCETKFDLYIFNQTYFGQELCLRSGNEPQNYCSPGSVTDFIIRNKNGKGWYRSVADLL